LYPFSVTFHRDRLDEPLKWKKPRLVFVCSMGDLFHESINFRGNQIRDIFRIMAASDSTFMLLTKRPQRMAECIEYLYGHTTGARPHNVWLGVTAENQARVDERIPILLQIPAAVRFVSIEPMLGPVNLKLFDDYDPIGGLRTNIDMIHWVICGGETGPGARPMHPDWVRSLRDQCREACVPFFFKQWGEYVESVPSDEESANYHLVTDDGTFYRVGKKSAGRLLDGLEWNEVPCMEDSE
jgi:protein gp37